MKMIKRALFVGRFQPFHHGHYYAVKKLLKKYREVVIVVGSSEDAYTPENPFTCGERLEMLRACFSKSDLARMIIVPVPDVNDNRIWVDHVFMHIPRIEEVYSNNALVKMLFSKHGILVNGIEFYDRGPKEGSNIRKMIADSDRSWIKHVPKQAVEIMDLIGAEERIKKIVRMGGRRVQ
ncbi:MAG TPA: nicotinamide-nucleotide adenylyltransferase [Candidatus Bilamarchaeum sp.]|nr:nicotinamide-nucleotide adenylyltransferase [Candidatus Bilamarchaeum sp.]